MVARCSRDAGTDQDQGRQDAERPVGARGGAGCLGHGPGSAVAAVCGGAEGVADGGEACAGEDQRHRRVAHRDGEDSAHDERSEGHDEMGGVPGVCHGVKGSPVSHC